MRMSFVKLSLIFLAAHVAVALFFLFDRAPGTAAALVGFPLDDAWIHMVYARSLAGLHGFAYNPGQLETGSTSPLWAVMLVPASWAARLLGISIVLPAKIVGVLLAVGASLAAARLAFRLGFSWVVAIAVGLAIAADPALAFAKLSGMEVMLAGALALWTVSELVGERYRWAVLGAALAPLARPELALLTLSVLAVAEWRMHQRRASVGERILILVPTILFVGGWILYCLLVSGYPLPNTFYAKFSSHHEFFTHNLAIIFAQVIPSSAWFARGTGFVLWVLGAVLLFRRGVIAGLTAAFPVLYLLAVAASQLIREPWPFYWQRYLLPAQPFLLVTLVIGAAHAIGWAWHGRRHAWAPTYAVGVALLVLGTLTSLPSTLRASADLFAWNCQNIEELNVDMAKWLRNHTDPGETIAVTDAGAARYFGERRVLDVLGLNNHRFLHGDRGMALELSRIHTVAGFSSMIPFIRDNPAWRATHRTATQHLTICNCDQSEIVAYQRAQSSP
jgi:hypothetical protein